MKTNHTIVQARRQKIMQRIQMEGEVTVEALAEEMDVSLITIRRDLQYWEDQGVIERYYGGARFIQERLDDNAPYKHAIARYAAQFVNDGDTILINTSSTALLLLQYLKNKRVTVVTNNGKAIAAERDPLVSVVLSGGELRTPKESMVGDFALNTLNRVIADKVFLGCSGISIESGMSTEILPEVSVNETMMQRCKGRIFLLADATKVGRTHQFLVAPASSFDYLITDNRVEQEMLAAFQALNVQTITVPPFFSYLRKKNTPTL